jgi:hypothetical protein
MDELSQKSKFLKIKLGEIERRLEKANNEFNYVKIAQLELEHQIFEVYLAELEASLLDANYLKKKGINLKVRKEILKALPLEQRMEIVCMTENQCEV